MPFAGLPDKCKPLHVSSEEKIISLFCRCKIQLFIVNLQKIKSMKKLLSAIIALCLWLPGLALDGAWRGDLNINGYKLPLVFNFTEKADGSTVCTLDSPLQGVKDLPAQVNACTPDSVSVEIKFIKASFSGKVSADGISGIFNQRGYSFPLVLSPEKSIFDRRPQTPRPPFPYSTVDTTFSSADGTELAGTLTLPADYSRKTPIVIFITGSGPQNRDEEMFEHRPFAVIADYLARRGIASLRYDDRGVAESAGNFSSSTISTFKNDAEAAVKFIRKTRLFGKIGIIGHSEGGTIALMLTADGKPDFVISLAGATIKGKDIILAQNLHSIEQLPSITDKQIADVMTLVSIVFDDVTAGKDAKNIDIDEYISTRNLDIPAPALASFRQNLASAGTAYFREFISLDPSEWLGRIKKPVFALAGTLDTQVNCKENLNELKKHVSKATVKEYPGLNHLLQHAATGEFIEYGTISETISPEVLDDIVSFINKQ